MNRSLLIAALAALLPMSAHAEDAAGRRFFGSDAGGPAGKSPPFSASVLADNTLYVAGTTDRGPVPGDTASLAAKRVLDSVKHNVEAAGLTMDDLVWVQIFSSNLSDYSAFNDVYRTYFKGPLPARAFLGVDHLLGGAKFEVMGIAVKR